MYHFDIPKTRQYDTGKIEVIARSSAGEAAASAELKVIPRHDDYRGVLKNAPRRKCKLISLKTFIAYLTFYTVLEKGRDHTNCHVLNKLLKTSRTLIHS